jgi:hypothetical protein
MIKRYRLNIDKLLEHGIVDVYVSLKVYYEFENWDTRRIIFGYDRYLPNEIVIFRLNTSELYDITHVNVNRFIAEYCIDVFYDKLDKIIED